MKETVIFEPYIPFFYTSFTLWDISIGTLTVSLIMRIFGFNDDYDDDDTQLFGFNDDYYYDEE